MIFLVKRNPYKTSYLWLLPGWGSIQVITESYQYLARTLAWLNAPTQPPHHATQQCHPSNGTPTMAPHPSPTYHGNDHGLKQGSLCRAVSGQLKRPLRADSFVLYRHCRIYFFRGPGVPAPCIILLPAHQGIPKILCKYLWIPGRPSERVLDVLVEDVVFFFDKHSHSARTLKIRNSMVVICFSSRGRKHQVVHDLICMQYLYVMFVHF